MWRYAAEPRNWNCSSNVPHIRLCMIITIISSNDKYTLECSNNNEWSNSVEQCQNFAVSINLLRFKVRHFMLRNIQLYVGIYFFVFFFSIFNLRKDTCKSFYTKCFYKTSKLPARARRLSGGKPLNDTHRHAWYHGMHLMQPPNSSGKGMWKIDRNYKRNLVSSLFVVLFQRVGGAFTYYLLKLPQVSQSDEIESIRIGLCAASMYEKVVDVRRWITLQVMQVVLLCLNCTLEWSYTIYILRI